MNFERTLCHLVQNVPAESAFMRENVAEAYTVAWQTPEQLTDIQMLQGSGYLNTSRESVLYSYQHYVRGALSDDEWAATEAFAVA